MWDQNGSVQGKPVPSGSVVIVPVWDQNPLVFSELLIQRVAPNRAWSGSQGQCLSREVHPERNFAYIWLLMVLLPLTYYRGQTESGGISQLVVGTQGAKRSRGRRPAFPKKCAVGTILGTGYAFYPSPLTQRLSQTQNESNKSPAIYKMAAFEELAYESAKFIMNLTKTKEKIVCHCD